MKMTNTTTNLEQAKKDFGKEGINSVMTIVTRTNAGNYCYCHRLNGNSIQPSKCYNPATGSDDYMTNSNYVHGYSAIAYKSQTMEICGYLNGFEVKKEYDEQDRGTKVVEWRTPLCVDGFVK